MSTHTHFYPNSVKSNTRSFIDKGVKGLSTRISTEYDPCYSFVFSDNIEDWYKGKHTRKMEGKK